MVNLNNACYIFVAKDVEYFHVYARFGNTIGYGFFDDVSIFIAETEEECTRFVGWIAHTTSTLTMKDYNEYLEWQNFDAATDPLPELPATAPEATMPGHHKPRRIT